ncbi:MAG: hypothetical protein R3F34_09670 [Planctomycetota bacterium]
MPLVAGVATLLYFVSTDDTDAVGIGVGILFLGFLLFVVGVLHLLEWTARVARDPNVDQGDVRRARRSVFALLVLNFPAAFFCMFAAAVHEPDPVHVVVLTNRTRDTLRDLRIRGAGSATIERVEPTKRVTVRVRVGGRGRLVLEGRRAGLPFEYAFAEGLSRAEVGRSRLTVAPDGSITEESTLRPVGPGVD